MKSYGNARMYVHRSSLRIHLICFYFGHFVHSASIYSFAFPLFLLQRKHIHNVYYDYSLTDGITRVEASQKRILCFSLFLFILTLRNTANRMLFKKKKGNNENVLRPTLRHRGLLLICIIIRSFMVLCDVLLGS